MRTSIAGNRSSLFGSQAILWLLVIAAFLLFPLRILNYGYLPDDDALRHAAKAINGKPWNEILVIRPEITIDHNPGWHWLLTGVHQATGWEARELVRFSVWILFVVLCFSPLFWQRRPETWIAAVAIAMLVFPYFAERTMLGRPLLLTMAITLALLCLWTRDTLRVGDMALSVVLFGLSTWVHGSWYLFPLLPISFVLARQFRKACWLTLSWIGGSFLGACLTGEPRTFLAQSALIPFLALGQDVPPEMLVGEFAPFLGSYPAAIVVAMVVLWRKVTNRPISTLARDPVLWLAVLGGLLGIRVVRFWLDWGLPALTLWIAGQLAELLSTEKLKSSGRMALAGVAAIAVLVWVGADLDKRWSSYGTFTCLDANQPENAECLPEAGGILYAVDMSVFYHMFFCSPHGSWRYVLGFEPTFMRTDNLAVYKNLCRTRNAISACAPWVERMTTADRMVLLGGPEITPALPGLEWKYVTDRTWVGRKPRALRKNP